MTMPVNAATGPTNGFSATATGASASDSSDYLTFLRMLTTQVQNQDPLNPMQSTDFAVQLATFSGVEQQVQTNDLLERILTGLNGGQLGQYAGWIGREVRTSGPVWFNGEALTLQIDPATEVDALSLVTLDSSGQELARENISPGVAEIDWRGQDTTGQVLPSGLYQFRLESWRDGEIIGTSDVRAYARVTGVETSAQGPLLVLRGNGAVLIDDVTGIRE